MRVANANFSAPSPSLGSSMDTISGKVNESEPEPDVKMRLIETPQVFSGETSDTVVSNSSVTKIFIFIENKLWVINL